jgi:predicted anti-sigma-YlaC factor YlaD
MFSRQAGNQSMQRSDYPGMDCKTAREALSARLDGEPPGVDEAALEAHVSACDACEFWLTAAREATRRVRLSAAPAMPDRTGELLAAVAADAHASRPSRGTAALRLVLALVGVAQVGTTVLHTVSEYGDREHTAREVAAFSLAIAVGFLIAALQPHRARAMAPVVGVAAGALLSAAVLDLAGGHIHVLEEVPHVLVGVGWLLLHGMARTQRPSGPTGSPPWHMPGHSQRIRRVTGESRATRGAFPAGPALVLAPKQGSATAERQREAG